MAVDPEIRNARRRLRRHINAIAAVDRDVASALELVGYPQPRLREQGFPALVSIVASQQVSTEAAASIWARVLATVPDMTASALSKCEPADLRAAGLSGRKVEYVQGLANSALAGTFRPEDLPSMSDEDAHAHIVAQRGFGPWSAEIYLMFSLRRPDIFAADDLALQIALQKLKGLTEKPIAAKARELVAHWSPHRSAGCLFLWHYYRGAP